MKRQVLILTGLLFFFTMLTSGFCADAPKIGVIDFQKIFKESSAGKMTQKLLGEKGQELQKKLADEKNQLEEIKQNFEREALVLSPEKQTEKQRDFRIRVNDFKKMQEDFSREFKRLEVELLNKIQKEVVLIAQAIGEKEGFSLVFEKKTAGIIYNIDQLDITDQIVIQYNLKASKAK